MLRRTSAKKKVHIFSVARRSTSTTSFLPPSADDAIILCVSETNHKLNRISRITRNGCRILGFTARKRIDFGKLRKGVLVPKRFCFVLQLNFSPAIFSLSAGGPPFCDLVLSPSYRHVIAASFLGQRPRNFAGLSLHTKPSHHTHNPHTYLIIDFNLAGPTTLKFFSTFEQHKQPRAPLSLPSPPSLISKNCRANSCRSISLCGFPLNPILPDKVGVFPR